MKKHLSTILLVLILLLGLSLLLYPTFSDWWNSFTSSLAIASYSEDVAKVDQHQYDDLWNAAWDYNQSLGERENHFLLSEEQRAQYEALLDISGQGISPARESWAMSKSLPLGCRCQSTTARRSRCFRWRLAIWIGAACLWAAKAATALSPATGACPQPGCLQTWIS